MADQTRNDMKINGDGSMSGGTYGVVTINGAGSVHGDADATDVRVNGTGTVNGNLVAQCVTVNGSATFNGSVQATELNVNGDTSIRDGAGISRFTIKGNATVGGGIAAHDLNLRGFLKAGADCDAESFSAEGAFTIAGLLNAGIVDIKVYGKCNVREIGGERITIRKAQGFESITQIFTFWTEKVLETDTIEGDIISLEGTVAKMVRGGDVTIGPDCRIDVVEYAGTYSVAPGSTVGDARKIEAGA